MPLTLALVLLTVDVKPSARISFGTREGSQMLRDGSVADGSVAAGPGPGHCHAGHMPTLKQAASASPVEVAAVSATASRMLSPKYQSPCAYKRAKSSAARSPRSPFPYSSLSPLRPGQTGFWDCHHHAVPSHASSGRNRARSVLSCCGPSSLEVEVLPTAGRWRKTAWGCPHPCPSHLTGDTGHEDHPGPSWGLVWA